jgi:hypothetical protein
MGGITQWVHVDGSRCEVTDRSRSYRPDDDGMWWCIDHEQYLKPEQKNLDPDGPLLGLATTRELLLELKARGETEVYYRELGDEMAIGATSLMDKLPGSMLDYRTVDN